MKINHRFCICITKTSGITDQMSKLYKMKGDNEIKNDDENKNIYIYI